MFLHVARVKRVQFSHGRVFSDSSNVQKCVTQIIYLGPLPTVLLFFHGDLNGIFTFALYLLILLCLRHPCLSSDIPK